MVTTTGSLAAIALPSASAGRVRSPRSFPPSDIVIAMSLVVTVLEYCAGRGVHFAGLVAACAGSMTVRGATTRAAVAASTASRRDDMVILPVTCLTNEDAADGLPGVTGVTCGGRSLVSGGRRELNVTTPSRAIQGRMGVPGRRTGSKTRETAVANDETGTTASAKKTAAKKSPTGTSAAKKTSARKTSSKRTAGKKSTAKKSPAKKSTAKKAPTAKKSTA